MTLFLDGRFHFLVESQESVADLSHASSDVNTQIGRIHFTLSRLILASANPVQDFLVLVSDLVSFVIQLRRDRLELLVLQSRCALEVAHVVDEIEDDRLHAIMRRRHLVQLRAHFLNLDVLLTLISPQFAVGLNEYLFERSRLIDDGD